jgi:hypothetical protein
VQLQVPLEAVLDMLANNYINNINKVVVNTVNKNSLLGTLLKFSIINVYVVAIAKLYKI